MKEAELLADHNSRAWDFAEKIQEFIKKEKNLEMPLRDISITHFRNGELDIHLPQNVRRKEIYFIHDSTKNPQEWWIELLLLKDLLLRASTESVTFVLPNMLYSRKDRKDKSRVPISASALAQSISPGLRRVITMDLHADQIQGFYPANCAVDTLRSFPEVVRYLEKNPVRDLENLAILSPDAGGVSRAKNFAQKMGTKHPICFIYKQREKAGEIKEMQLVGDVKGLDILIVDDIVDSGNTQCNAAKLLKENGARELYCYSTHGIFTKGVEELSKHFNRIMVSNTHNKNNYPNVEMIDVSPVFAEAIYRAQKGISISSLFE